MCPKTELTRRRRPISSLHSSTTLLTICVVGILEFAGGVVAGVGGSVAAWWLVALALTPRLEISGLNRIRDPDQPCGFRYRLKVRNLRRRSLVSDLEIQSRLVVRGLDSRRPHVQTSLGLPVAKGSFFPVLLARRDAEQPEDVERVFTINIHDMHGYALERFPDEVRTRIRERQVTLEELLALGGMAFVRIAVSGSHGRSGFRRTYARRLSDVQEGEFIDGSIKVRKTT